MSKTALITGVTGQDGSCLAEFLLNEGYRVIGVSSGKKSLENVREMEGAIKLIVGDVRNPNVVREMIRDIAPDEVYNLASVTNVFSPWEQASEVTGVTALAPVYLLEAIADVSPSTRYFQASSAEVFGHTSSGARNENSQFNPETPYGHAKAYAFHMTEGFRKHRGIYAVSGILFNHESSRRGEGFLSKKVVTALARIAKGGSERLTVGNLDAARDWGYAGDFVRAMNMMLNAPAPRDYVIATGETHTVRDFIETAAIACGIHIKWEGNGVKETGVDASGRIIVEVDERFYRKDVGVVYGDISNIRQDLGWQPSVNFKALVETMIREELAAIGCK